MGPSWLQLCCALLFATTMAATAATECQTAVGYRVMQIEGRPVAVWYPTAAKAAPFEYDDSFLGKVANNAAPSAACVRTVPLIVFSHGYTGCALQSIFLVEELARHGYVVAAPDHADASLCHTRSLELKRDQPHAAPPKQPGIFKPEAWNDATRKDRREDIEVVINALLADTEFGKVINAEKVGLAGHSLGGYTVVGMAGGWPSWRDERVRAVLALSPYVMPFQAKKTLSGVRVPLMYQGGTLDMGITPFLTGPHGAYAAANPPVYFVELRNAGHFAWVNCGHERSTEACLANVTNARLIDEYSVAFFDKYLKGENEPLLQKKNPALADFLFRQAP
jgi:predicted dienelactone hydrolase